MSTAEPLPARASLPPGVLVAFRPVTAMRAILARGRREPVEALVAATVLATGLAGGEVEQIREASGRFGWIVALLLAAGVILLVCAFTVAVFYAFAWFTTHTGRLLGARGSVSEVRSALAWGLTPLIWGIVFRIPSMVLWPAASSVVWGKGQEAVVVGNAGLRIHTATMADAPWWQVAILTILELAVILWFLIVASRTLGVAQKIPAWKALANVLLAFILPAAAMIVAVVAAVIAKG